MPAACELRVGRVPTLLQQMLMAMPRPQAPETAGLKGLRTLHPRARCLDAAAQLNVRRRTSAGLVPRLVPSAADSADGRP